MAYANPPPQSAENQFIYLLFVSDKANPGIMLAPVKSLQQDGPCAFFEFICK